MEKVSVEYDPLTGVYTTTGFVDDKLVIHKAQDLEPVVQYTRALQNADDYKKEGIKKGWWHVCHVPETLEIELLQNGVDINTASLKTIVAKIKELGKEGFLTMRGNV
jgi:hypothetical protein